MTHWLRVICLIFVALSAIPAGAHLFSLISKMQLSGEHYLVAQRAYDSWSLFGIAELGALASTLALAIVLYRAGQPFTLVALAFGCIVLAQVLFWSFTFPANQATGNWTMLPEGWSALRAQWEYSHAASALLKFAGFALLALATAK